MSIREKEFETWLLEQFKTHKLSELISNFDEMKKLATAYINNPFISHLQGSLYQLSIQNWAKGILLLERLHLVNNR